MSVQGIQGSVALAIALHRSGRLTEAAAAYEQVLRLDPRNFDALHLSGVIASQTNEPAKAVERITRAIANDPGNIGLHAAHANLGAALKAVGRLQDALASFDRAIAIKPDYAIAHSNRGTVLAELESDEAALASYDLAIAIRPDAAAAHFNRGNLLKRIGDLGAALESYDRVIALDPAHVGVHSPRGDVLRELGQLEAAIASFDRALTLNPQDVDAHAARGVTLLLAGDFAGGWPEYEWRSRVRNAHLHVPRRARTSPRWLGAEPLVGKTIVIHAEQGLGDSIQFCRYAKPLAHLGAQVILEVDPSLTAVLSTLEGVAQVIPTGGALPEHDYHCPIMSLPLAFKTTLETIPAGGAYLRADERKVARWHNDLGARSAPRVGLVWSGNPHHTHDRYRSIALGELLEHLPSEYEYVSLQKEVREPDRLVLRQHAEVTDPTTRLTDFSDTAALCSCLDLVISVDTSVAHLSAALGRPTWILLPCYPDWRWLMARGDSPWYPSVRLYRQQRRCEWGTVLTRVRKDMGALPGC
ncbi:MAG: glycosyltransferase family protein [Gammaproteobacteria bacterium]|nr:glycosyltransferase family protein [Gammaproteobacteria bacterium]